MSNTTKHTTQTEYLSALLDDEAGAFEKRRLLDDVQQDQKLQQKVATYSLIGEAMRNEHASVTVRANFLTGIHDQLATEPAYNKVHIKPAANQPSWFKPVTGMALAASLAAIIVVGVTTNQSPQKWQASQQGAQVLALQATQSNENNSVGADLTAKKTEPLSLATSEPQYAVPNAAWRKRLKSYVNSHVKYASTSAIMPSVRAVSYAANF